MRKIIILLLLPVFTFAQDYLSQAEVLFNKKKFVKAQHLLESYLVKNDPHYKAIELLGDTYGQQKKWDEAIIQYKKLTEAKPNIANYHYKYGGALGMKALTISKISALGIIGNVKTAFLRAAALDKKHIDTRWALVELYMQLPVIIGGSKSKSFKYAEELLSLSKVDGYFAKGYIYEYDHAPILAKKYYKLALNEVGNDLLLKKYKRNAMHYQIGKVCADYNLQLEKAEAYLKLYVNLHSAKDGVPKAWAYYRLAQIYKHQNNNDLALQWINKAIKGLPKIKVFNTFKETIK